MASPSTRWAFATVTVRTPCDGRLLLRWLIVVVLTLLVFSGLRPWLEKFGLGRLPGDFRFRLGGREWWLPIATTLVLSLLAGLIGRLI